MPIIRPTSQDEADARLKDAFTKQEFGSLDGEVESYPIPDQKSLIVSSATAAWAERILNTQINPNHYGWQGMKNGLVRSYFGETDAKDISDEDLFGKIATDYQSQDKVASAARIAAARGESWLGKFRELEVKESGNMISDRTASYIGLARAAHDEMASKINPYRKTIKTVAEMARNIDTAPDGMNWGAMASELIKVPKEDRPYVLEALSLQTPGESGSKDAETIKLAFMRGMERYLDNAASSLVGGSMAEIEASAMNNPLLTNTQSGEVLAASSAIGDYMDLRDDMRDIATGKLAPLNAVRIAGMNISGAVENIPMTLGSFVPYVGVAVTLSSFQRSTYNEIRRSNPTMSREDANSIATISAPIQAITEIASDRFLFGRLPNLKRAFTQPIFSATGALSMFTTRAAIGTATEVGEEFAQGITPLAVQSIAKALGEDLPGSDWDGFLGEFAQNMPELISTILPLAIVGAGTGQLSDFRAGRQMARSADMLIAAQYSPEAAAKISELANAGKWGEAEDAMRTDWAKINAKGANVSQVKATAEQRVQAANRLKSLQAEQANVDELQSKSPEYTASVTRTPTGWQVTTGEGTVIPVESAEAARRIAVDLRQVGSQEEADTLVGVIDSYYEQGKQAETVFTGEKVMAEEIKAGEGRVFAERRDAGGALISQREFGPKALETVREEAEVAGIKSNTRGVFAHINGSNEVFPMRVADGAKEIVRRMNLYKSQAEGQPQVITFLHENFESTWQLGMANGTFSEQETRTAMRALLPAFEGVTALNTEEAQFIANLRTLASGKGNETMLRETVSEMVIRDVLGRDRQGRATGMKPGSISRAIEASVMGANTQEEASALKSILAAIKAFTAYLKGVFSTVDAMIKANEEGKIGAEYDTFINKVLGIDEVKQMESQAVDEVKALLGIDEEVQAVIDAGNMAFSISPANSQFRFEGIAKEDPIHDGSRVGTAWQGKVKPTTQDTNDSIDTVEPKELEKQMGKLTQFIEGVPLPKYLTEFTDPVKKMREFIAFQKANLLALYDAFEKLSSDYVVRSTHWYDGARLIAERVSNSYGLTVEQSSAIIAVFSPMKDWFQNVAMGQRFADIMANHKDTPITENGMKAAIQEMLNAAENQTYLRDALNLIEGRSISNLLKDKSKGGQKLAAVAVRLMSTHVHGLTHDVLSPEGDSLGIRKNLDGSNKKMVWQSYPFIEKALSIYENGSLENISKTLGTEHKIRNFYNNIIAPTSPRGDATVDTHAVNAAVLFPMGGSAYLPTLNFGDAGMAGGGNSGIYWLFHEALREAAAERNVMPRQMQSITWEAIRGLFTDTLKRDKKFVAKIIEIWESSPNAESARNQILELGIAAPEWARMDASNIGSKAGMGGDIGQTIDSTRSVQSGVRQGRKSRASGANVAGPTFSISPAQDAEYLDLAKNPEKNRSLLQKMVDAAAKAAGYLSPKVYHGTQAIFNVFDELKIGSANGRSEGSGFYFTTDQGIAKGYQRNGGNIISAYLNVKKPLDYNQKPFSTLQIKKLLKAVALTEAKDSFDGNWKDGFLANYGDTYSKSIDSIVAEAATYFTNEESALDQIGSIIGSGVDPSTVNTALTSSFGYDAFFSSGFSGEGNKGGDIYVVMRSNQIKSADPVTRDDAGNIIPLSQRFNEATPDIRFSISPVRNLNELSDQVERQFAENPVGALEVKSRVIRQFAKLADKWSNERWTPQGNKIRPISEKRTVKSLDKEQAMRQAQREVELVNEGIDKLTPNTLMAYSEGVGVIQDDPLVARMLNDNGKLMSKSTAAREGRNIKDQYDDAGWIPPQWYAKAGGIMPDVMANNLGFDTASEMWAALDSSIKSHRNAKEDYAKAEAAVKAVEKAAFEQAKAEAQAWRDETDAMQKEDWSPRESLVRDLITLEAIVAMFPQEIRGKIGGFVALARKASESARLKVLQKQLERGQVLLEKHLKEQYGEAVDKLFDKYRPERKAGEKPKGKLDPDAQEISDKAEMAMELSADQVNAEIAAINVLLDADNISAEEEAKLEAMRELVQLLGDWKNADSARRESAFIALNDVLTEGWAKWKLKKIFERERRQELRDALISDIGKPSLAKFRDKQNEWSKSVFGKPFSMLLSISSFSELLTFEFGGTSKTARMLEDKERAAAYAYEDAMQELSDRIGSFFTDMAGGQLKGEQLRFDLAQNNLTIGTGDNERIISQLRGIQALLMWQQEDGRRHMEGPRDENGAPIEGKWSYDQAWIDELISKLSPEALEIKKLLEQLYGEEWVPLNAVYRERNGVNLPRHDKYAPITVTPQQAKAGEMVDPVSGFAINGSILTPGSLRGRNKRAVAEPRFDDAIQIFLGHSRQMEHWKAYYDFATEAQAVLLNRDVMNAVESKGSKQAVTVLKKWIDTFAQGGNRDAQAGLEISNLYSRASGRAARIALFGRVSTIFIQSVQLAAASVKMPLGSYLKRLGMLASGQLDYVDVIKSPFMQRRYKTAPPIVQQAMADVGDVKRPNFFNSTTPRFLGNSLSGADVAFTGGTYAMILDYHRTVTGPALNLKGEELELYAQNEAERDTEAVAQPVRAGTRSIFENTLPTFAKTGFSFASEARQKISLFAWSAYKTKSDPAQAAKVAFLTFIVGGLFTQVIKNLWREAKGDDDEKMWSVERLVKATVAGPLHGVPGVSELTGDSGLFSGFGWSASAVKKITEKAMEDKLDEVTARDIENALSAAGYFNDTAAGVSGASHAVFDFAKVLENIFGED